VVARPAYCGRNWPAVIGNQPNPPKMGTSSEFGRPTSDKGVYVNLGIWGLSRNWEVPRGSRWGYAPARGSTISLHNGQKFLQSDRPAPPLPFDQMPPGDFPEFVESRSRILGTGMASEREYSEDDEFEWAVVDSRGSLVSSPVERLIGFVTSRGGE